MLKEQLYVGKKKDKLFSDVDQSDFIEIKEGPSNVFKWGWIPQTELIWYETQTFRYYSGILEGLHPYSTGEFFTFNVRTGETQKLKTLNVAGGSPRKWSPDGEKLLYFSSRSDLTIFNREKNTVQEGFSMLSGSPEKACIKCMVPPPFLQWSEDSSHIYFGVSPQGDFSPNAPKPYTVKNGHSRLFAYSLKEEKLIPLTKELEDRRLSAFSEQHNQFVLERNGGLYLYHTKQNIKKKLLSKSEMSKSEFIQDVWFHKDSVYYLIKNRDNNMYTLNKIDIESEKRSMIFSNVFPGGVDNIRFLPSSEVMFFTSEFNKEEIKDKTTLYRMEEKGTFELDSITEAEANNINYNLKD